MHSRPVRGSSSAHRLSSKAHQILGATPIGELANGLELPAAIAARQAGHDDAGVSATLRQIEARDFGALRGVDDAAVGVFNFFEILPGETVYREHQVLNGCRYALKVDVNAFIVAVTFAGAVVS